VQLFLYNTITKKKELFQPINKNLVRIYVCGPTVYDSPHIGNARSAVIYDLLYRVLRRAYTAKAVIYIRNITDIDDKIIAKAKESEISISELTTQVTKEFHSQMRYLSCLPPTFEPKATKHVSEMIWMIQRLIDAGIAYVSNQHVYFDVNKFPEYMELSGRNRDEMLNGFRIENDDAKNHHSDFVLWKPSDDESDDSASFDSPFGRGRPGWHIECSVMSNKYLGRDFDIHGGGSDLIFPHHTNEIAQAMCAFPNSKFAKYWVHNGFLTANGQKMSKSLGNFVTIADLINEHVQGDIIRLFLLSGHYRKPLDYSKKSLDDAAKMMNYWYRAVNMNDIPIADNHISEEFLTALYDDMNSPLAIKIINDYAKNIFTATNIDDKRINASKLLSCANLLGLMHRSTQDWFESNAMNENMINDFITKRKEAKNKKEWVLADEIRNKLLDMGIILEDKANDVTTWRKDNVSNKQI